MIEDLSQVNTLTHTQHPGGRPPHYRTPEKLHLAIEDYFVTCDKNGRPYTVQGLAYHLGFASRSSFRDYSLRNNEFSHIIKRAKFRIEVDLCERVLTSRTPAGTIFTLKAMHGWQETQVIEHKHGIDGMDREELQNYIKDVISRATPEQLARYGLGDVIDIEAEEAPALPAPRKAERLKSKR